MVCRQPFEPTIRSRLALPLPGTASGQAAEGFLSNFQQTRQLERAALSGGSLMRSLVLGDDVARNPPALADLVSALASPFPDLRAALTARAGPRLAAATGSGRPARVVGECADLL